jgi:hypothetical protein
MTKTGESYTAARSQITRKPKPTSALTDPTPPLALAPAPTPTPPQPSFAKLAGMSDDKVKAATGSDWTKWVYVLDRRGAAELSHREIVQIVRDEFKVQAWWTQMVAVGYERIKGLRTRGQQRNGSYEATKSRTFNVPVDELFDAWASAKTRKQWLDGKVVKVRTSTASKSMRLDWADGGIIAVGFASKGEGKSSVAVSHAKLPDRETVNVLKLYWAERLASLGEILKR